MGRLPDRASTRKLGLLGLSFWTVHALDSVLCLGEPQNLLWACNLAALFVGIGLLFRWRACNSISVLWLSLGLFMWILDLLGNGKFIWTSLAIHIGGLWVGLLGIRILGMARGSWWQATIALAALQQGCRWFTARHDNVNLAFAIWPGWERFFPSYPVYWLCLLALSALVFLATERLCRKYLLPKEGLPFGKEDPSPGREQKSGIAADTPLDEILDELEMPPEGLASWFARLRAFCGRHGGSNQYGELLALLDRCDAILEKRASAQSASRNS